MLNTGFNLKYITFCSWNLFHSNQYLCLQHAFNQRGVWVSFGHPIADFGHPNIHIFCV